MFSEIYKSIYINLCSQININDIPNPCSNKEDVSEYMAKLLKKLDFTAYILARHIHEEIKKIENNMFE